MADRDDQASTSARLREIGLRVQHLRNQEGLTQRELTQRCGVARSHIADIELGKQNPTVVTLLRLAAALRVDLADLVDTRTPLGPNDPPTA
jgi:transcriptional regulator with XRE-family HTH domain